MRAAASAAAAQGTAPVPVPAPAQTAAAAASASAAAAVGRRSPVRRPSARRPRPQPAAWPPAAWPTGSAAATRPAGTPRATRPAVPAAPRRARTPPPQPTSQQQTRRRRRRRRRRLRVAFLRRRRGRGRVDEAVFGEKRLRPSRQVPHVPASGGWRRADRVFRDRRCCAAEGAGARGAAQLRGFVDVAAAGRVAAALEHAFDLLVRVHHAGAARDGPAHRLLARDRPVPAAVHLQHRRRRQLRRVAVLRHARRACGALRLTRRTRPPPLQVQVARVVLHQRAGDRRVVVLRTRPHRLLRRDGRCGRRVLAVPSRPPAEAARRQGRPSVLHKGGGRSEQRRRLHRRHRSGGRSRVRPCAGAAGGAARRDAGVGAGDGWGGGEAATAGRGAADAAAAAACAAGAAGDGVSGAELLAVAVGCVGDGGVAAAFARLGFEGGDRVDLGELGKKRAHVEELELVALFVVARARVHLDSEQLYPVALHLAVGVVVQRVRDRPRLLRGDLPHHVPDVVVPVAAEEASVAACHLVLCIYTEDADLFQRAAQKNGPERRPGGDRHDRDQLLAQLLAAVEDEVVVACGLAHELLLAHDHSERPDHAAHAVHRRRVHHVVHLQALHHPVRPEVRQRAEEPDEHGDGGADEGAARRDRYERPQQAVAHLRQVQVLVDQPRPHHPAERPRRPRQHRRHGSPLRRLQLLREARHGACVEPDPAHPQEHDAGRLQELVVGRRDVLALLAERRHAAGQLARSDNVRGPEGNHAAVHVHHKRAGEVDGAQGPEPPLVSVPVVGPHPVHHDGVVEGADHRCDGVVGNDRDAFGDGTGHNGRCGGEVHEHEQVARLHGRLGEGEGPHEAVEGLSRLRHVGELRAEDEPQQRPHGAVAKVLEGDGDHVHGPHATCLEKGKSDLHREDEEAGCQHPHRVDGGVQLLQLVRMLQQTHRDLAVCQLVRRRERRRCITAHRLG
eukprot:Rhum_TRINITY_DN14715_c8_g1::Rhum_TRINITY_DN14715_c8_g1_i1::g.111290::m.111290